MNKLCDIVSAKLKRPTGNYLLPAGLVLSGGGANLSGLQQFAKDRLGLSVRIGGEYAFDGLSQQMGDPAYAVAAGLVLWGAERTQHSGGMASKISNSFPFGIFQ